MAYVFVLAGESGHHVMACDGPLEAAVAARMAGMGETLDLLWAEAVSDLQTAEDLVILIEALDDARYADLLAGEDEARSLLVSPPPKESA